MTESRVTLPINEGSFGKFVQLYAVKDDSVIPILRISEEPTTRHGSILRRALVEHLLEFRLNDTNLGFPEAKGDNYEAVGMGRYELKEGVFVAHGCSVDYEMKPNEEHFRELQALDLRFKFKIDMSKS